MLIGVVGDYNPANETHTMLDASLAHADAGGEWISTDAVPSADGLQERFAGIWLAPASPYRSMDGALASVTAARERGIPLVATCGGFQHVLVEYARNVLGAEGAQGDLGHRQDPNQRFWSSVARSGGFAAPHEDGGSASVPPLASAPVPRSSSPKVRAMIFASSQAERWSTYQTSYSIRSSQGTPALPWSCAHPASPGLTSSRRRWRGV